MYYEWEVIKDKSKGPVMTLVAGWIVLALILATFGWGFLIPTIGWGFVAGIVGIGCYVVYVTIHDTIYDINARR